MMKKIYPRTGDTQTVYLNAVVKDPSIEVGDYTIYNDFNSWRCSCQTESKWATIPSTMISIVGGVPARPIRKRFTDDTIQRMETLKW